MLKMRVLVVCDYPLNHKKYCLTVACLCYLFSNETYIKRSVNYKSTMIDSTNNSTTTCKGGRERERERMGRRGWDGGWGVGKFVLLGVD